MSRKRKPPMKRDTCHVYYGTTSDGDGPDVCLQWGGGAATKRHSNMLHWLLCSPRIERVWGDEQKANGGSPYKSVPSVVDTLKAAGFDITTLRLSIEALPQERATGGEGGAQ